MVRLTKGLGDESNTSISRLSLTPNHAAVEHFDAHIKP